MNDFWWFTSRATGIVATVLAVAALVSGFFFSSRNTGERRRPGWWLDLHNWLGGLALAFTGLHVVTIYLDRNSGIGLPQIFVPGTAAGLRWAIAWGVVAMYLFAITVFTSWPQKHFSPRVWRTLHLGSVAGVGLAALHAFQSGSDAKTVVFEAGLTIAAAFAVYALMLRAVALMTRRTRP